MPDRAPSIAVAVLIALFWVGDLSAGLLQPGYSFRRDYVSSLAGFGAAHAWIGMLAIAVTGLAHAAAGIRLRELFPGTWLASALLVGACLATLVVAVARIHCPRGAAGCHLNSGNDVVPRPLSDRLHASALPVYEVCFVLAALVVVVLALRAGRPVLGAVALAAGVASPYLALTIDSASPGVGERLWIAAGHAFLLVLALTPGES